MRNYERCLLLASPFWLAAAAQGLAAQTTVSVNDVTQLRAAITTANGDSNSYILELATGTYTLTGGALEDANASGDLDFTKSAGAVTIRPATGASATIHGGGADRVFHVNNGPNAPLTLQDLTIQGGLATDEGTTTGEGRGGAILKLGGGALTLQSCTLIGNEARGAAGADGAAGGPTGDGSPGTAGAGALGGGLYIAAGTVTISACAISQNAATGGAGGDGGFGGIATASNFGGDGGAGGNGGGAHGGAIYLAAGTLSVTLSTLSQNSADGGLGGFGGNGGFAGAGGQGGMGEFGGAARGAAIYVQGGTADVLSSTLDGNSANGGHSGDGGEGANGSVSGGAGGQAATAGSAQGGAIFGGGGTITITQSTLSNNDANGGHGGAGGGGGDGLYGGNGVVAGNGGFGHGGGVFVQNASVTLSNSTLSGNSARGGDGGPGGAGGDASFTPGVGADGGAAGMTRGGGVYVRGVSITIRNCTIAANEAVNSAPGAGGAAGTGSGTQPAGNTGAASPAQTGGAFEDGSSGASVDATSTIFADNIAPSEPDAGGVLNATDCVIENGVTPAGGSGNLFSDPGLAALAGNGGPTQTHAIGVASNARNAGSNPQGLTTDQRGAGFPRDDGGGADIGAFEFNGALPTNAPVVTNPAGPISVNATSHGVQGTAVANSMVRIYTDTNNDGSIAGESVVGTQQLSGGGTSFTINVNLTQNAANNFLATADDGSSGESLPTDVPTITEDSVAPADPVVTTPPAPVTTSGNSFAIGGTAEADSLVRVYIDFNNDGLINSGDAVVGTQQLSGGATSFSINTPITQSTTNNFTVTATDAAGNSSNPVDVPTITENTPAVISPPLVTDPNAPVSVNAASYSIQGTAQADSLVRIYSDANNDGFVNQTDAVVASLQLASGMTAFSIPTPLAQGLPNNFVATADDGAGNESLPANVPTITENQSNTGGGSGNSGGGCSTDTRHSWWGLLVALGVMVAAGLRRSRSEKP